MKKTEINQWKAKSLAEIIKRIAQLERQKTEVYIQIKMNKVKNVHNASQIKKDIAILKTISQIKSLTQDAQTEEKKEKI